MTKLFLIVTLFLTIRQSVFSQQEPIIKANSKQIKILDGDDLREGSLVPELKPDIYTYHKTIKSKKITFYTDIDSISFIVKPGDTYNFAVLLNNKDTCYQKITSENPNKAGYIKPNSTFANDTISFVLGANNAIHIKGKINNSEILDLIFDTGASVGVLSEQGLSKKVKLLNDNKNQYEIAGILIKKSPVIYVDYNGGLRADGVIGYNSFEDKVVEINYDKEIIVIHDSVNDIEKGYSVLEMQWRGSGLFIEGILNIKNKKCSGLFLFDTGSKWALSLTKSFSSANQLYKVMTEVGTREAKGVNGKAIKSSTVSLPELKIANFSLINVPIDLELPSKGEGLPFNILGNDILKRFNVILDYKSGLIYLHPNSLTNAPYNKSVNLKIIIISIGVLLGLMIIGLVIYKKRKSRQLNY